MKEKKRGEKRKNKKVGGNREKQIKKIIIIKFETLTKDIFIDL